MSVDRPKAPWHLWLVGALALAWNGFAAYDFINFVTQGPAYLQDAGLSPEQVAYYASRPNWMNGPWVLGVWGGVAGAILLLLRSRWAVHAFAVSLFGAIALAIYTYALSNGVEVLGAQAHFNLIILGIAAFLAFYAFRMLRRGVLR